MDTTFKEPEDVLAVLGKRQGAVVVPKNGHFVLYGQVVPFLDVLGKSDLECLAAGAGYIHGRENVFVFQTDANGQPV